VGSPDRDRARSLDARFFDTDDAVVGLFETEEKPRSQRDVTGDDEKVPSPGPLRWMFDDPLPDHAAHEPSPGPAPGHDPRRRAPAHRSTQHRHATRPRKGGLLEHLRNHDAPQAVPDKVNPLPFRRLDELPKGDRRLRETPMCAAAFGPSFGSSTWLMCQSDFSVMQKGAIMAVSSPRLVSMALGEKVEAEDLGGWRLHAEVTGLADQVVDREEEVFDAIKRFLSYLPSHHHEAPPDAPVPAGSGADMDQVFDILPESRTQVYDMKRIIRAIVDKDTLFEIKPRFGKSAVVGLARLGGRSVGIVANNPLHRGGALDADACRKIVDFLVLCDSFNVPIVLLVDTPGFQIGTEAERAGAPGKIMNFMNAMTLVTVPRLSVRTGGAPSRPQDAPVEVWYR